MHWNRGGVGSKVEIGAVDRKRFGDTLDKHLEKSPPIASRVIDLKETDKLSGPSTSSGKQLEYPSLSNNKCSDGRVSSLLSCSILFFGFKLHFFFRLSNAACALRDYSFFLQICLWSYMYREMNNTYTSTIIYTIKLPKSNLFRSAAWIKTTMDFCRLYNVMQLVKFR